MRIVRFFDRLEDRIRGWFSHWPILYGFVGGIGVVLFWRGVWHTADWASALLMDWRTGQTTVSLSTFPDGPLSFVIGAILLLLTGLFVSSFIGNEIIMSGLRGEKKLTERTEQEVRTETGAIAEIRERVRTIDERLEAIEKKLDKR